MYYPVPMHLQECFAYLGHGVGAFPESEKAAQRNTGAPGASGTYRAPSKVRRRLRPEFSFRE